MRVPTLDPTAGERARRMRLEPDIEHRVTDPTNPRYGRPPFPTRELGGRVGRRVDPTETRHLGGRVGWVVDPTDPACARRLD
jgi:hypothetical protein